jgi:hypothetical protein
MHRGPSRRTWDRIWIHRSRLAELGALAAVATILHLLLFLVLYRAGTDPTWFMQQYLGPVRTEDEIWGRIVSGALLLVVVGWGIFCTGIACLDLYARLRGAPSRIGWQERLAGAGAALLALVLAFLLVRTR